MELFIEIRMRDKKNWKRGYLCLLKFNCFFKFIMFFVLIFEYDVIYLCCVFLDKICVSRSLNKLFLINIKGDNVY